MADVKVTIKIDVTEMMAAFSAMERRVEEILADPASPMDPARARAIRNNWVRRRERLPMAWRFAAPEVMDPEAPWRT